MDNDWYKANLYESYSCLNRDQRDSFYQIMKFREMYTNLEGEFELYRSEMEAATGLLQTEVEKNKANANFYMKLCGVLVFLIAIDWLF